ncbi:MAG: hypothetical protein EXS05_03620 [Planctomycetaceae bacterium]|nr:hypothetical protein [Planctomycetaceae bacterium]
MKLRFDAKQNDPLDAVAAVISLFAPAASRRTGDFQRPAMASQAGVVAAGKTHPGWNPPRRLWCFS